MPPKKTHFSIEFKICHFLVEKKELFDLKMGFCGGGNLILFIRLQDGQI